MPKYITIVLEKADACVLHTLLRFDIATTEHLQRISHLPAGYCLSSLYATVHALETSLGLEKTVRKDSH